MLVILIFIGGNTLLADIPKFDVITISFNSETYYFKMETRGQFTDNDLCYTSCYNHGVYTKTPLNIHEIIDNYLSSSPTITLYRAFHIIHLNKMRNRYNNEDFNLYLLKNKVKLKTEDLINKIEVTNAVHGNTYGYIYTNDLDTEDNNWINDYPIEKIFNLGDPEGMCTMEMFAIKGNLRPNQKWKIRWRLTLLLRNGKQKEFQEALSELHKKNIIMIGFCSC